MKAILVIDIPNEHLWKTLNDIYERMKGYKCSFKQIPDCPDVPDTISNDVAYIIGWNDCLEELEK